MANLPYDCYDDYLEHQFNPKDELLAECSDYFRDILQMLYSAAPLDRCDLEELLANLGKLLKVELPEGFLSIKRRENVPMREFFSQFDIKSLYVTKKTI